jgi:hypothetical protein
VREAVAAKTKTFNHRDTENTEKKEIGVGIGALVDLIGHVDG